MVDTINRSPSSSLKSTESELSTITFQISFKCEACAYRIKRAIISHFPDSVKSVSAEINSKNYKESALIVYFDERAVHYADIRSFISDELLNESDRAHFFVKGVDVMRNS